MKTDDNNQYDNLSDNKKMTIINVAILTLVGTDFKPRIEGVKAWGDTEEEQAFTDAVFAEIKARTQNIEINAKVKEQLKAELYDRFAISKELQAQKQEESKSRAEAINGDIAKQKQEWAKQDKEDADKMNRVAQKMQAEEKTEFIQGSRTIDITPCIKQEDRDVYKWNLYKPHLIATAKKNGKEIPLIKLSKRKEEEIVDYEYEHKDMQYTIRRTGELLYRTFIGVNESLSEYEITIRKDDKVYTARKFGHISIPSMEYEGYRTEVLTGLLGKSNLEDPELHSYMGTLEEVEGPTREIQPYKVAHSEEEYTAVMILEELEKQQTKGNKEKWIVGGDGAR